MEPTSDAPPGQSPDIAWLAAVGAAVLLSVYTLIGLSLAMAGQYDSVVAAGGTVAIGAVVIALARQHRLFAHTPRADRQGWSVAAIGVLSAAAMWVAATPGQHLVTRRDPGSYLTTARWLSRAGTLRADVSTPLLDQIGHLGFGGPAVYRVGPREIEFQFSHGASTVMAGAYDVAGSRGLLGITPLVAALGMLCLFLLLRQLHVHPGVALAAVAALAVSAPMLFVTRNTYSEPYAFAALWAGLLVIASVGLRHRGWLFVGSWLIGSTVMYRVDALLYVAALAIALAFVTLRRTGTASAPVIAIAAITLPAAVGFADQRYFAGGYAHDLSDETRLLLAGTAASVGLAAATMLVATKTGFRLGDLGRRVAIACGGCTGLGLLGFWLVRPRVQTARGDWAEDSGYAIAVRAIQKREDIPLDGLRSYAEYSVAQIGWYFGAALLTLAICGFVYATYLFVRGDHPQWSLLAPMIAVATPLYLWRSSITPDQVWATRRFMPFIIPAFVLAAALAGSWLVTRISRRAWRTATVATIAVAFVLPTALATWPIRTHADQRGALGLVHQTCSIVGNARTGVTLSTPEIDMTLRAWCGVNVGDLREETWSSGLHALIEAAQEQCTPVFIITKRQDALGAYRPFLETPVEIDVDLGPILVQTLDRPPSGVHPQPFHLTIARYLPSC